MMSLTKSGPTLGVVKPASPKFGALIVKPTPVPKYQRIRDWLMDRILSTGLGRGDKLPSESDLTRQFDVSRVTVRQALEALRDEGIIESRHGKGWFLRRLCAVQNLGRLQGFGEMLAPLGVDARSEVLDLAEVLAPEAVATAFGLPRGSDVMQIARLRIASGRVMSYDLSYFMLDVGRRLREHDLARQDIFVLLERSLDIQLGFADVTIEIGAAEKVPALRLGIDPGEPIFKLTRLTHDRQGYPVDFEYVYGLPETHQFKVRVPRR